MEMVLLIGAQGAGKSTFFREWFFDTHVRVNLDMLKTRHRERELISACFGIKQRFVVDNTNPTARDRRRYFELAQGSRLKVAGYYFDATLDEVLLRNAKRAGRANIPEIGVRATHAKLEAPSYAEGFDEIYRVRVKPGEGYEIERVEREEGGVQ
jgi:predicted kinase